MTYSNCQTRNHPLAIKYNSKILELLNELLINEGAKKEYFNDEIVLNIGKLEIIEKTKCASRCKTMDFCIGLSSSQMLLVEVKLNVSNPVNVGKKDLEDKIRYSKILLGEDIPIAREKVFIFNDRVLDHARRHISRLFSNNPNLKIYTINEFRDLYFVNSVEPIIL